MGIEGIVAFQINGLGEIYADPANPIAFWRATYTASIDVPVPIDVALRTDTSRFDAYPIFLSLVGESRLGDFEEGAAVIRVVPAPVCLFVLAGLFAAGRRRHT